MSNTENFDVIVTKLSFIQSIIITILSYLFGPHWFLFAFYLFLNICDHATGTARSRINKTISSEKGAIGILKKLCYWVMIAMAFGLSAVFVHIGKTLGINLAFTSLVGYLTLATLIINECRSIVENLVEAGCNIPTILIKGLEVANKVIEEKSDITETDEN